MLLKSTPQKEGIYQASKWLKFHVLCDEMELGALFDYLNDFFIYPIGKVFKEDVKPLDRCKILENYKKVLYDLKKGFVDVSLLNLPFVVTKNKDAIYLYEPKQQHMITQIAKPVIQWQIHQFRYSEMDGKIRSMVFGKDSIFWGFEFSFPTLFQDPITGQILKVDKTFENFSLFALIKKWIRNYTRPTPFIIDGKVIIDPMRLGKNCFSWIQLHPGLKHSKIAIR